MFLERLFIANVGPLVSLSIEMPFDEKGLPKPLVLLGTNGSGKTNVLSVVTDALFEMEAEGFTDVLPEAGGGGRSYFRLLGPATRRTGAPYSVATLCFRTATASHIYVEKTGTLSSDDAKAIVPSALQSAVVWGGEDSSRDIKKVYIGKNAAAEAFSSGAYCYFPSSRTEKPDWLNSSGIPDGSFDLSRRLRGKLNRPLFVESGLDSAVQWLMGLVLESRMNVVEVRLQAESDPFLLGSGDPRVHTDARATLGAATLILREVLGDANAQFSWLGRQSPTKIGVSSGGKLVISSLHALSAGQATLLTIFLTLLRYADHSRVGLATRAEDVEGICIVDEIDAHMHVDLQYRALPTLVGMFPKVQFLLTSHSPLFVLGMSVRLGATNISLVGLPDGTALDAEAYSEFRNAFDILKGTTAFDDEVAKAASVAESKLLVWVEGETDPEYLRTAARVLGRESLLDEVEFSWIGAKQVGKQTNFHSGKDALNQTHTFLRANPGIIRRPVLLLYDNDANKPPLDEGTLHVRSIASDPRNSRITAGIEHLLPDSVFTDDVITIRTTNKPNGSRITFEEIDKAALCQKICNDGGTRETFDALSPVLDLVEAVLRGQVSTN